MADPIAKTMSGRSTAPAGATRFITTDGATSVDIRSRRSVITRLRRPRRPRVWFELLIIGVSYWLYSQIRNAVPQERAVAVRHARDIWDFERQIGLGFEHAINHAVNPVTPLIVAMNYFYSTLHFLITVVVLVWLFVSHPGRYGPARSVLFITTWLALVGFWLFPLAPPRLLPGAGFLDTVRLHHTWGSIEQGNLSQVSNQFAAMPSLHIGWSLWCGVTIVMLARHLWLRILGALYPVATLVVITSTGNHFWMDAAGGAVCLTVGYTVVYYVYGRLVYRLPRYPEPAQSRLRAG
ncbi:phosphatase PAP2 family protein [Streptomyces sp. NBC_01190]|uniref:phosphatase PAP2 family protein n=1 Tax=Streptomyces sp. NBC_01190 TaxID=2903767 RepID=UPI00386C51B2|nr:phosphatase PAP2 family protein [Streptomyces sp. NBC_01190]